MHIRGILFALLSLCSASLFAQQTPDPHSVPAVDAQVGPCTADFIITDTEAKPIYAAKVSVHVAYGMFHKIDLEVSTNVDGKARIIGLPIKPKRGLLFLASEGDRSGNAFLDPSVKCKADFTITLRKQTQEQ